VRFHAAHPDGPAQRISDCMRQRAFRHSAVFADYYRRLGIRHVLALPLRIDPANVISVVFNRGSSDFRDNERALLEALRRPLAALYGNVIAREQARAGMASLQDIAASGGWHVIRLGQDGRPIEISEEAARLMRRFFPAVGTGHVLLLPEPVADWLRRNRNWGLDRLASDCNVPLTVCRAGAKLSLRFVFDLAATAGGFLLMKSQRHEVDADHLASLPLTLREREILSLVTVGKTNAEIAMLLTISPRTVQKHLEHVFQKLGVETRTAAAMCALAAAGENFDIPIPI
jgi:DNA-binding CsgD family transcriptional regulator